MEGRAWVDNVQERPGETAPRRPGRGGGVSGAAGILALQRSAGNRATAGLLQGAAASLPSMSSLLAPGTESGSTGPGGEADGRRRSGLALAGPGAAAERQADRVADSVAWRSANPGPSPDPIGAGTTATRLPSGFAASMAEARHEARALPAATRSNLRAGLGPSADDLKVHAGPRAAELNALLGSDAFTHGSSLYFGAGRYAPESASGAWLVGHEAAHGALHRTDGMVHARLAGTANAMIAQGGKGGKSVGFGSSILGSGWSALTDEVKAYESKEAALLTPRTTMLRQKEAATLLSRLTAIERLATKWLAGHGTAVGEETTEDKDRRKGRLDPASDTNATDRKTEGQVEKNRTRAHLVQLLLPRVRLERHDVSSGRAISAPTFANATLDWGIDQKLGDQMKKLDVVVHKNQRTGGTSKGLFSADVTGKASDDVAENQGELLGISQGDPNWGARAVAMARLDELLGANIMAKTEFGTHTAHSVGGGGVQKSSAKMGFRQEFTEGTQMGKLSDQGRTAVNQAHAQKLAQEGKNPVNLGDPNLQRLLSILAVIDAVAGQLDRHTLNYFVKTDARGRVTGLTGIDLDMAFAPGHTDVDMGVNKHGDAKTGNKFVGVPVLVDKTFGEAFLKADKGKVREVLTVLLAQRDVDAAMRRWDQVRAAIQGMKARGELVSNWDAATLARQTDERTSYVGAARMDVFSNAIDAVSDSLRVRSDDTTPPGYPFSPKNWKDIYNTVIMGKIRANPNLTPDQLIIVIRRVRLELIGNADLTAARTENKREADAARGPGGGAYGIVAAMNAKTETWAGQAAAAYLDYIAAGNVVTKESDLPVPVQAPQPKSSQDAGEAKEAESQELVNS